MLKKSLSIFLLLTIIFSMAGIFIVFKTEQAYLRKSIKQQIKAGIPEDELHFFSLSKDEYEQLDWVRPDKEFREDKEMFDVVRSETSGDSVQLYCVNDKEETVLFAQLDELVQKKMEQESNAPNSPINKVVKILKLVYVHNHFDDIIDIHTLKLSNHFITAIIFSYSSPYLKVLTPPPNTV